MGMTMTQKILAAHAGLDSVTAGQLIEAKLDVVMANDITGPMALPIFRQMADKVFDKDKVVLVPDHFTPNKDIKSAENSKSIREFAKNQGLSWYFEQGKSGVEHAILPEAGVVAAGECIIGADSHTCTYGALGAFSTGVGSTDMAAGMATGKAWFKVPSAIKFNLTGKPAKWVSGKDVILHIIGLIGVDGALYRSMEFVGDGIKYLSMDDRFAMTNMAIEAGGKNGIFPVDDLTIEYMKEHSTKEYTVYEADEDAVYDQELTVDLSALVPMTAKPHSPDAVVPVKELEGMKINQVVIGSCTNSSLPDMLKAAKILKGRRVATHVSLVIAPGSSSILAILSKCGALADMIASGARILECGCGPCIGMGQAPLSKGVSLRTINRNFKGRSGTNDASVYLVSPEVAALSAIKGYLTDEFEDDMYLADIENTPFVKNKNFFIDEYDPQNEVYMGPNIKPVPRGDKLPDTFKGKVCLKVGDNISTDHIVPSDSKLLPYRSNVPHLAKFSFCKVDDQFYNRCIENGGGFIVGGDNYGQGSSREHAALVPNYLKIKAIFAISFARIHRSNLINNGILPLVINQKDYDFFN